ncbi:unnamed protein product [Amoebophrya sp. A25]|nr:unnamed protein product [Amoebophrya sp. A25]|eukprot:GSA25T00010476001.1
MTERMAPEVESSLWLDCDPGVDDAVALVMASAERGHRLLGVSTVTGNVSLDKVTKNARKMLHLSGRSDVRVYAGAERPLLRPCKYVPEVHGESGLDGSDVLEQLEVADHDGKSEHAVEAMRRAIMSTPAGTCWLLCTGPLTNAALLFSLYGREVCPHLAGLVFMGGAVTLGNMNSAVEFNMAADPEAARIVLEVYADRLRETVMVPLDLTSRALVGEEFLAKMAARVSPDTSRLSRTLTDILRHTGKGHVNVRSCPINNVVYGQNYPVHDPCALFYIWSPNSFRVEKHRVEIETGSSLCSGQTVVDLDGAWGKPANVKVAMTMDLDAFFENVIESVVICAKAGDAA